LPPELFTIGHSTHSLEQFVALLGRHDVKVVADVRRFPGSRKFPQFNRDALALSLPQTGVDYRWIEALGGRRTSKGDASSENLGLRNESFRSYADYMATEPFREGVSQLLGEGERKRTAFMCSEGWYWRCHRRLVSDYLLANGFAVHHIMPNGEPSRRDFLFGELNHVMESFRVLVSAVAASLSARLQTRSTPPPGSASAAFQTSLLCG
jgi:uncharacterized protein (DUF488 family)